MAAGQPEPLQRGAESLHTLEQGGESDDALAEISDVGVSVFIEMLHDSTAYVIIFNGHVIAWIELGRRIHKDDGNMAVCQTLIHIRVDVAVERIQNQSVHPELDDVFDDFPLALLGAVGEFDGHTDVFVAEIGFRPFYNGEGLGGAEEHEEYHVILLAGADDIVDEGSFFRSAGQQVLGYQNLQGFPHRHPGSSVNLHQFHFGGDLRARLVNPALDLCQISSAMLW